MAEPSLKKRIWGWYFFDWASQPYNTLLLTFIFAPYIKELLGDGARAQTAWGFSVAAAGIAAGLLFAFMPLRLGNLTHPTAWDICWTVLAFFFAERLFAHGRWRDALGLAAATALQIAADFYPLVAATFLSLPLLGWMAWRHRLRAVRPAQLVFVGLFVLLAAAGVLLPYLGAESELGGLQRTRFRYFSWSGLVRPSALPFPGWTVVALALVAMLAGRKRAAPGTGGDPRWALLAGALLVGAIAAGPNNPGLPNLHTLLAAWIPGLDAVRGIFRLSIAIHLALVVLAGLGAGALIRATRGRQRRIAEIALVAIAAFDVLRLPAAGLERRYAWAYESIRPDADSIAFFQELERRGNRGPMLELPELFVSGATRRILLGSWHRRRTSACYGSFRPAGQQELVELAADLPSPEAVDRLRSLGFTTVVLHLEDKRREARRVRERIESAARDDARIVPVHATSKRLAYQLLAADPPGSAGETR